MSEQTPEPEHHEGHIILNGTGNPEPESEED